MLKVPDLWKSDKSFIKLIVKEINNMTKFKVVKSWIEKHSQEYIVEADNK